MSIIRVKCVVCGMIGQVQSEGDEESALKVWGKAHNEEMCHSYGLLKVLARKYRDELMVIVKERRGLAKC